MATHWTDTLPDRVDSSTRGALRSYATPAEAWEKSPNGVWLVVLGQACDDPLVRGDYQRAAIVAVSEIVRRLHAYYVGMTLRPISDPVAVAHHAAMSELLTVAGGCPETIDWRASTADSARFDAILRELRGVAANVIRSQFDRPPPIG